MSIRSSFEFKYSRRRLGQIGAVCQLGPRDLVPFVGSAVLLGCWLSSEACGVFWGLGGRKDLDKGHRVRGK